MTHVIWKILGHPLFQTSATGVDKRAQPKINYLETTRAWGHCLASFSRLRIQNCSDIFLGSWTCIQSGIAVFLWSVVMFSCKPLGGWECYCPRCADSDMEAQPGQNEWCHTWRNQVVDFGLVPRPDMCKHRKLAIAINEIWAEGYRQPQSFINWVSSDQGDLASKLHQHIHKTLPAMYSLDCLNSSHAFGSGLRHSHFKEQSFKLESNMPKLKSSLHNMRSIAGKGNESLYWTTSQTFLILWPMYIFNRPKTPQCRKCNIKCYQRYSLLVGKAFIFKLTFWAFDLFGTIAHEKKRASI